MSFDTEEQKLREQFVEAGRSLYERGYATGSAGNMSLILPDGNVLTTPTGSCLGRLDPAGLSKVSFEGELISGPKATKEVRLHIAVYRHNPEQKAVVHLHSTYATALSCLKDLDANDVIRPFTPYVVMRMNKVLLVPYHKPGSAELVAALDAVAAEHNAFLLANHGPITAGRDLTEAVNNAEELEATAKLYFVLGQDRARIRYLSADEIKELR